MSIKFASVKKTLHFPPTPKSFFLETMHDIRGIYAALHNGDLPIWHFRNPWHNGSLEYTIYIVL